MISRLIILLGIIFLTGCNFIPQKENPDTNGINFDVISDYPEFNQLIKSKLDQTKDKKFVLKINQLSSEKFAESYKNNSIDLYKLIVEASFSLYYEDKLLFDNLLRGQRFFRKPQNEIADESEQELELINSIQSNLADRIISIINAYN